MILIIISTSSTLPFFKSPTEELKSTKQQLEIFKNYIFTKIKLKGSLFRNIHNTFI